MTGIHTPVLLEESLEALAIDPDGIYLDGTFGRGGHACALLARLGAGGSLLGLDRDPQAVAAGSTLARRDPRFAIEHMPISRMEEVARRRGLFGRVSGLLLDLGVSSPQLEAPDRGFSFSLDGPLDMRMDTSNGQTAAQWLAQAKGEEIARVLWDYGEERRAGRIARAIVRARGERPLVTTCALGQIVAAASPNREPGKHPATRTFQAIRIHINRELDELRVCLANVCDLLTAGGRLVVISFHSLEDRIVKRVIRNEARGDRFPRGLPVTAQETNARLRSVGKPVRPSSPEVAANPRARSALMRVAERLA
ncbi:16S rRNA (cytosine(1402)-N(4))-methyltransferase RsmH [Candidatus Thiosymbion oneisti]|uniref:16S rRNA (cytosine(1402)-N(4))-methyltransferase RsmH n=1 Tax=Candidatus Thiosymbion oneisti TaxID=589554 RepID=UPI000B129D9D|nr:16S rRNA (cytosine(1402)-N(4))-methyltransferase RsmH [Candidatus Thiosymbion oneisti]